MENTSTNLFFRKNDAKLKLWSEAHLEWWTYWDTIIATIIQQASNVTELPNRYNQNYHPQIDLLVKHDGALLELVIYILYLLMIWMRKLAQVEFWEHIWDIFTLGNWIQRTTSTRIVQMTKEEPWYYFISNISLEALYKEMITTMWIIMKDLYHKTEEEGKIILTSRLSMYYRAWWDHKLWNFLMYSKTIREDTFFKLSYEENQLSGDNKNAVKYLRIIWAIDTFSASISENLKSIIGRKIGIPDIQNHDTEIKKFKKQTQLNKIFNHLDNAYTLIMWFFWIAVVTIICYSILIKPLWLLIKKYWL